jgi:hypothetical protein
MNAYLGKLYLLYLENFKSYVRRTSRLLLGELYLFYMEILNECFMDVFIGCNSVAFRMIHHETS